MITSGWRRLGLNPFALVFIGLALVALTLSRGAGSGWLVVVAAADLAVVSAALAWSILGLVRLRVDLGVPGDATVGEALPVEVAVRALVPQARTVMFRNVDGSTHFLSGANGGRVVVHADRRCFLESLVIEIRGGLPLGLFRFSRVLDVTLPTPLAIAPVPAVVSLLDSIGEDAAAEVRGVRAYVAGDAARLIHWRSSARRGELMVRELASAELLRGAAVVIRVSLPPDQARAEAAASEAFGVALAALDAGLAVRLATVDATGPRVDVVTTRRAVGRRLAAAVVGNAPAVAANQERTYFVDVPR